MFQKEIAPIEQKQWKMVFVALSAFILIIMPLLSHCYGLSGDEWLQINYGADIWNYFFNGDKQALDYSNKNLQYQGIEFYGGLFDYLMHILHKAIPSVSILALRHFFNAITGGILIIFTGLLAFKLSKRWMIAVVALLFIFFSPRIFGESMNNPKDIPFAMGFIIGIYYFLNALENIQGKIWKNALGVAIGFGIAFGVRPAGGLMQLGYFVVIFGILLISDKEFRTKLTADKFKLLKRATLYLVGALALGYIIGLMAWPWGLQDPLSRPLESLKQMTNIRIPLRVLFEGVVGTNNAMPKHYEFKWICISNPLIVLILTGVFPILALLMMKKYRLSIAVMLVFCAVFPPLYMIMKKSSVHDTWRHLFFIWPYWVIMAALSVHMITEMISNAKLKIVPTAVAILGLLPAITWLFHSHPNQYLYFNETVGGLKGAYGYYETDYYQNTNKQAADWLRTNVKPIPGRKIIVRSNMRDIDIYLGKDTSWMISDYGHYEERSQTEWDYFICYSRGIDPELLQTGKWPPKNALHVIQLDGVPLCAILQRKSTDGIAAAEAYKKKDLPTALAKYESYLKADPEDETAWANYAFAANDAQDVNRMIPAFSTLLNLNPTVAENIFRSSDGKQNIYNLLASLYQSKGDAANAAKYNEKAKELVEVMQTKYEQEAEAKERMADDSETGN